MAQVAIPLALGYSEYRKGRELEKQKKREAQSYMEASQRRQAAMTREVAEEKRKRDVMEARALTVAAASGAGVDVPGVINLIGDLNAEGWYRMLAAMYTGQTEAAGYQFRAEAARAEASAAKQAGIIGGITSAITGYYMMGGFSTVDPVKGGLSTVSPGSYSAVPGGGPKITDFSKTRIKNMPTITGEMSGIRPRSIMDYYGG